MMIKIPEQVKWELLIRLMRKLEINGRPVVMADIARRAGIGIDTLKCYIRGSQPNYTNGAKIINAALSFGLGDDQLRQAGIK